jgi:hypothetical protein
MFPVWSPSLAFYLFSFSFPFLFFFFLTPPIITRTRSPIPQIQIHISITNIFTRAISPILDSTTHTRTTWIISDSTTHIHKNNFTPISYSTTQEQLRQSHINAQEHKKNFTNHTPAPPYVRWWLLRPRQRQPARLVPYTLTAMPPGLICPAAGSWTPMPAHGLWCPWTPPVPDSGLLASKLACCQRWSPWHCTHDGRPRACAWPTTLMSYRARRWLPHRHLCFCETNVRGESES